MKKKETPRCHPQGHNGSSGELYPMGNCSGELYPMGNCIPPSIPCSVWLIRLLGECVLGSGIKKYNNDLHRHSPNPPETIVWGVWHLNRNALFGVPSILVLKDINLPASSSHGPLGLGGMREA